MKQAVILAGGLGTRLMPFTKDNPKAMIPVEGHPFLYYLIEQVRNWGFREVVLLLGYLPDKIQNYFEDGSKFGIKIRYVITPVEYETAARIYAAKEYLEDEFLLMYCDNYCPIDYEKAYQLFCEKGSLIQITAYENTDNYTKNNLIEKNNDVIVYDKSRTKEGLLGVDIGYIFMRKQCLSYLSQSVNENASVSFEKEVYPKVISEGKMSCFVTKHRYYSIGSWERMELTKKFFKKRKIVFLDRDGTINVRPPKACYVEKPEDFVWIEGAKEAIKVLKEKKYDIYIVSNQPGIARGNLDMNTLELIHTKMRNELREIGTDVDGIYLCPHNWDDGCECRKPKPGMFFQAQKEHSLNLSECILIGDDERDIQAGETAGIKKNILVTEDFTLWDAVQLL